MSPHIKGFEERIEAERTAQRLPGMFEVDVGPGDCIFIPRGWWHQASALGDDSVTLTWAVWTCTWANLLAAGDIDVPASATEPALRTPLSLDANSIPEDLGLGPQPSKALALVRAQAELRAIADVVKDWQAGLEQRSRERRAE